MKRRLITEIATFLVTLIIAIIIYVISFGQQALFEESLDINVHDTYFVFLKYLIVWQTWFLVYFTVNLFRQFWLKFKNQFCNTMFIITALFLSLFLFTYIQLVSDAGTVLTDEGMTIYPPLTGIPQQSQNNMSSIKFIINTLWTIEIVLWLAAVLTMVMMYRNRKSTKA